MNVEVCTDDRFELIEKAKAKLLEATNIEMRPDEMAVIDSILFRCWQMGWLDQLREAATLGGGECEFELNTDMSAIRCSSCGYELPKGTDLAETRFCGGCGKAVKR